MSWKKCLGKLLRIFMKGKSFHFSKYWLSKNLSVHDRMKTLALNICKIWKVRPGLINQSSWFHYMYIQSPVSTPFPYHSLPVFTTFNLVIELWTSLSNKKVFPLTSVFDFYVWSILCSCLHCTNTYNRILIPLSVKLPVMWNTLQSHVTPHFLTTFLLYLKTFKFEF